MEPIKKGSLGISPGSYYAVKGTYSSKITRKRKIKKIFTLYSAVNVGLGILNPSAKLHVTLPTRLIRKNKIKRIFI